MTRFYFPRMSRSRGFVAGAAIAVAAVVASTSGIAPAEGVDMPPPPADVVSSLSAIGVLVGTATTDDLQGSIDPARATAIARERFIFVGGERLEPYLVRFTDEDYGPTSNEGDTIDPVYVQKLAWMVLIWNAQIPIHGPEGYSHPSSYTAPLAVFLEASTGDFLTAVTA